MSIATLPKPRLQLQIDELRRENLMRDRVYPHLIASRKLNENAAAYQKRNMAAAAETLEALRDAAPETTVAELLAGLKVTR
jgi:Ser-tRNA(Ala) deacylase AlaX